MCYQGPVSQNFRTIKIFVSTFYHIGNNVILLPNYLKSRVWHSQLTLRVSNSVFKIISRLYDVFNAAKYICEDFYSTKVWWNGPQGHTNGLGRRSRLLSTTYRKLETIISSLPGASFFHHSSNSRAIQFFFLCSEAGKLAILSTNVHFTGQFAYSS